MFNEGRTNVHDDERSGRPSLITEDLKNRIVQHIRTHRLPVIFIYSRACSSFLAARAWVALKKLNKTVKDWFNGLAADLYDAGLQKLVTRYKCLYLHGDYVEK
jgi:hypothetical protein